ncbi:MAG: ABC transporter ATP-binding protein [Actinomycetaceae bacterium]|nr:ABC transporter ATP-binding protein [Actinomycetaceae bacterium]
MTHTKTPPSGKEKADSAQKLASGHSQDQPTETVQDQPTETAQEQKAKNVKLGDPREQMKRASKALKDVLKPVSPMLNAGRLIGLASAMVAIAPYIALTRISEILLSPTIDQAALHQQLKFLVIAFLTQLSLVALALMLTHFADLKLRDKLRKDIVNRIGKAPLSWFSNSTSGAVRKAIQDDTNALHLLIAHAPVENIIAIFTPLTLFGYAFYLDWRLGLLTIATIPFYIAGMVWMTQNMGEKTAEMDMKLSEVSATAVEFADGIEVVKGFGRTGQAHSRYAKAAEVFAVFFWNWCKPFITGTAITNAAISISMILTVNLGGGYLMILAGWVTLPEVLTCSLIALVLPLAIDTLMRLMWAQQMASAAALRIVELLKVEPLSTAQLLEGELASSNTAPVKDGDHTSNSNRTSIKDSQTYTHHCPSASSKVDPISCAVYFNNVSYAYIDGDTKVQALQDVTLCLPEGSVTALVGASGSGKSTLATMLARFRDPDQGSVNIFGKDIRTMTEEQLYSHVAFVLQESHVMRMSIRDNISLARPQASEDNIRKAAAAAQILEDINALPAGFDTIIDEDTGLSGGQKQRISIARAILANTPILILDEATASTDPDCEAEIQSALTNLIQGKTVLVIGHHAESVAGADRICVLEQGRIIASGTQTELHDQPYWNSLMKAGRKNNA